MLINIRAITSTKYLIISYHFPPSKDIGSRRWAKFSKYLLKKGNSVTVITSTTSSTFSPWDNDVKGLNIIRLSPKYPAVLNSIPKSIFAKINYRLTVFMLKLFVGGTIYDRAIFWRKQLQNSIQTYIKENKVDVVIVNGPPHRLNYYVAELVEQYPGIKFWCDLRDPWTCWDNMGYAQLNEANKRYEFRMESYVFQKMHRIFVPNEEMKAIFDAKYPARASSVELLEHAFDRDDICLKMNQDKKQKLKLIYFGSLYTGLDDFYKELVNSMQKRNDVELTIYTFDEMYNELFCSVPNISVKKPVASNEILKIATEYDYFLLVYPGKFKNYLSTKIYEILVSRIPILYVGEEGKLSDFIAQNKFGLFEGIQNSDFNAFFDRAKNFSEEGNYSLLDEKSFDVITDKLIV